MPRRCRSTPIPAHSAIGEQAQVQRAAGAAAGQSAATSRGDPGDSAAAVGKHDVQLGWMARRRVLFAIEASVERAIGHQSDSVVGLSSVQPRLTTAGVMLIEHILVLARCGERPACGNRGSERRCEAGGDGVLCPRAINIIHVETARLGTAFTYKFQSSFVDVAVARESTTD